MTKKQRQVAIKDFKAKLAGKGWKLDRFENWMSPCKQYRVKLFPIVWKHQHKIEGKWVNITARPIARINEHEAPELPKAQSKFGTSRNGKGISSAQIEMQLEAKAAGVKLTGKSAKTGVITKQEAVRETAPLQVKVSLDPAQVARLDTMAFKQVQTMSRMDKLESTVASLVKTIEHMSSMVETQMKRIKAGMAITDEPVFYHKMFNKISLKLRKKSVDVIIEDIHNGAKRRRVFRCSDWSRVDHLLSTRTLSDGIEELAPRPSNRRKAKPVATGGAKKRPPLNPPAKKRTAADAKKALEDIRHEMMRDGIQNTVIPDKSDKRKLYDKSKAGMQELANRTQAKAEKVIVKLCSPGGPAEGAKDQALLTALEQTGFESSVAFYAAMNCGRITDPKLIAKHETKRKPRSTQGQSNEY